MSIKLKAKLYGESYRIHALRIAPEHISQFQEIAKQLREPLDVALLNINFFQCLNSSKIQSILDLSQSSFGGLINNNKSQVELWLENRRILKLKLENLVNQQTLFPLYKTQLNKVNSTLKSGLYLEEKEIGTIGVYEILIEKFEFDNLKFYLSEIAFTGEQYQLLNEIRYNENSLKLIKSDTLLRYQRCLSISNKK